LSTTRLLTLTGPGGIGKTRLALRVAADVLTNYPHGVWLVRLDSVANPDLVPAAVAAVLDIRERPGCSLVESLTDAVGTQRLLLVLDNCEHLVAASAALAHALLQACPHLQLLATSREPLSIPGESVWRLSPLSVPDPQHVTAADQLR